MLTALESDQVKEVLSRLARLGDEQDAAYSTQVKAREAELGSKLYGLERAEIGSRAPQAVAVEVGRILHSLVLAARPQFVVEFGTSFGVSTIYLAAALHDLGQGRLLATELIEAKARAAAENLTAAGLADATEIRQGDARETLADLDQTIDVLFLDGSNDLYLEILQMLEPRLAPHAVVAADLSHGDPHHDRYRAFVNAPDGDYVSVEIPIDAGLVVSTRR